MRCCVQQWACKQPSRSSSSSRLSLCIFADFAVGTPYYIAPEVFRGDGYTMMSEVWSLGCILYELISMCLAL